MMTLIATIIFFGSFIGMGVILYRKIPLLAELPEVQEELRFKRKLLLIKEKIKKLKAKLPPIEIILQKILSKIRILILKLENKISVRLEKLREKSVKKKENEKYWKNLKESINQEKFENKNQPE